MALLPSNKNDRKHLKADSIKFEDDVHTNIAKKMPDSRKRRPVQVDPQVLQQIRSISYAKDMPMYDVVAHAISAYIKTLSTEERKLYDIKLVK